MDRTKNSPISVTILVVMSFHLSSHAHPLQLHLEPGASIFLDEPQSERFTPGFGLGVGMSFPLSLHVAPQLGYSAMYNPASDGYDDSGTAHFITGGARLRALALLRGADEIQTEGLFVDFNLGYTRTQSLSRFAYNAAVGYDFRLAPWMVFGPYLRYGQVVQPDGEADSDPNDAQFLLVGLAAGLEYNTRRNRCGDGEIADAEKCDSHQLGGQSCESLGFEGGYLQCSESCDFNTAGCCRCGDKTANCAEQCDSDDLRRASCQGLGYLGGDLKCSSSCTYDTTSCEKEKIVAAPRDTDGDGGPDTIDRCPRVPGPKDAFYCPIVPCGDTPLALLLHFHLGTAKLKEFSEPRLMELSAALKKDPSCRICIEGHASEEGTEQFNCELSLRRATFIKDFLVGTGIDQQRLEITGFGEGRPILPDTLENRPFNRRVEFKQLKQGQHCPSSCAAKP